TRQHLSRRDCSTHSAERTSPSYWDIFFAVQRLSGAIAAGRALSSWYLQGTDSYTRSQKRCWATAATKLSPKLDSSVANTTPVGLLPSGSCTNACPVVATPIGL